MKRKYIFIAFVAAFFVIFYFAWKSFSPGSGSTAQEYQLNVGEPELITLIKDFKYENPTYQVPDNLGLKDGRSDTKDHLLNNIYFYYPEEKQVIYVWTRPEGMKKSTLAFASVKDESMPEKWNEINKDFDAAVNREQIDRFETRILNKIRSKIK
jgi:hypothetical protein